MIRVALAATLVVALAGCGSSTATGPAGRATLWVTRDRGAQVLHVAQVPAGSSVMQALERVAKVKTRYGGRYARSVDGLEEHGQHAWFYYVNGYLADRSAAEYRLRPGDLAWWDYRAWRDPAQDPVVIGAFPQPFLRGYDGQRRPAIVVTRSRAGCRRWRGGCTRGSRLRVRRCRVERTCCSWALAPEQGSGCAAPRPRPARR